MPSENSRWNYTLGSRAEGVILYDEHPNGGSLKLHSHNDTDAARGQHNAFDLVRIHKFGHLDAGTSDDTPITERPSFRAMCELAEADPAVKTVDDEFEDLGELKEESKPEGKAPLARTLKDVLSHPTRPRWLLRDVLECATIVLLTGPRGSYKSFIALDWAMRVAVRDEPVYCISAEGGDFDRRAAAWLMENTFDAEPPPLYVVERRLDLNADPKHTDHGIHLIRQDCVRLGIRPRLFVLDTFSKLSGGLDENSNTEVKQFIGRIDNGLKRAFDAAVLIVAHTGHSDATRARGASALEADTEAAHIVVRDQAANLVTVSRERFKSSPELPPLAYRPKVVDLGRTDEEGVAITSLIMEPVAELGATRNNRKLGKNQKAVFDTLKELGSDGRAVDVNELLDATSEKVPKIEGVRDTRRQKFLTALEGLLIDGMCFKIGNSVSLTRATMEESASGDDEGVR